VTSKQSEPLDLFFHANFWTAAAAIWTAAVMALALSPNGANDWMAETLGDKVLHMLAFVVGGFVWVKSIEANSRLSRTGAIVLGMVAALIVGIAIEILQRYVPTRSSDLRDLEADIVGLLVALGLLILLHAWHSSKSRSY
jgi:VanZ family protein